MLDLFYKDIFNYFCEFFVNDKLKVKCYNSESDFWNLYEKETENVKSFLNLRLLNKKYLKLLNNFILNKNLNMSGINSILKTKSDDLRIKAYIYYHLIHKYDPNLMFNKILSFKSGFIYGNKAQRQILNRYQHTNVVRIKNNEIYFIHGKVQIRIDDKVDDNKGVSIIESIKSIYEFLRELYLYFIIFYIFIIFNKK